MTYLKASDEKSKRLIIPSFVGDLNYKGKKYLGLEGYCLKRNKKRVFRVDRILDVEIKNESIKEDLLVQ